MTEHVCTHDWPITGRQVDPEQVARALAEFDWMHAAAVRSLAETTVPREDA